VFMDRLMNRHIKRYLRHYPPASPGHIYQGRYTNALVETGRAVITTAKYIESNGSSAGLVERAEHYPWSSASPEHDEPGRPILAEWPVPKPADWLTFLNTPTPADELKRLRRSLRRGSPYGSHQWIDAVVKEHGLEHTVRKTGTPTVFRKKRWQPRFFENNCGCPGFSQKTVGVTLIRRSRQARAWPTDRAPASRHASPRCRARHTGRAGAAA